MARKQGKLTLSPTTNILLFGVTQNLSFNFIKGLPTKNPEPIAIKYERSLKSFFTENEMENAFLSFEQTILKLFSKDIVSDFSGLQAELILWV